MAPVDVTGAELTTLAMPKSVIFTWPSRLMSQGLPIGATFGLGRHDGQMRRVGAVRLAAGELQAGGPSWGPPASRRRDPGHVVTAAREQPCDQRVEFHISPARARRFPRERGYFTRALQHGGRGSGVIADSYGLSTASSTSGMGPSSQQRTSYRNAPDLPCERAPTGPSRTTPRPGEASFHAGAISMTYRRPW